LKKIYEHQLLQKSVIDFIINSDKNKIINFLTGKQFTIHQILQKIFLEMKTKLLLLLMLFWETSIGQYTNEKLQEFLLSAYNPPGTSTDAPPYPDTLFTDYKNAGFDTFLWIYDDDSLLNKIHQYKFKYFINIQSIGDDNDDVEFLLRGENDEAPPDMPEYLLQRLDSLVDKYKNDPYLIGYYICDEPFANAFDNIAKVINRIRSKDSSRVCYVNLWPYFPNDPDDTTPEEGDNNYLEEFIQKTHISLLSYDRYIFYNLIEGENYDDVEEYFNQIERIRAKALKYDIPFCNIVQAIGTNGTSVSWDAPGNGEHLDWRTPSESEHRWLVYTSLAYGVHGIVWFHWDCCDWGVIENPDRDTVYPSIKSINHEIDSLKNIMFNLKTKSVYHLNGIQITRINNIPDILFEASQDAQLIVGTFETKDENYKYFMLVNKDYEDSISTQLKMNYSLKHLQFFNVKNNTWEEMPFEPDSEGIVFTVNLRAGGGKLFRFQEIAPIPSELDFSINPNPFSNITTISYTIPEMFHGTNYHKVELHIYDTKGKKVATLINQTQSSGQYTIDIQPDYLSNGLYICVLKIDNKNFVKKVIKTKSLQN